MKKYNIPFRTLEEGIALSVPRRSNSIARAIKKYPTSSFDGSDVDKAYLIGFRLGDLWVGKNKYGETIYISSGTTKQAQLDLMQSLFEKYGMVYKCKTKGGCIQFTCHLNLSFDFLLPKEDKIPDWVLNDKGSFIGFFAGYADAEGHFGVHKGIAEFSIASYDINILSLISKKLNAFGIECQQPKLRVKNGFADKRGVKCHRDFYRLRVTRKKELFKLIQLLKQHLKHAKRFNDLLAAEANIIERNNKL